MDDARRAGPWPGRARGGDRRIAAFRAMDKRARWYGAHRARARRRRRRALPRHSTGGCGVAGLVRCAAARAGVVWWSSEIAAAIPTVFAATQEKFVPQMINFEVLGGVDFRKGCYPGQEIVARSQYLGKLKRRMQRGRVTVAGDRMSDVAAGADVYHSDSAQPVGTVVMAAPSSSPAASGDTALLFEVPLDRLGTGSLHVAARTARRCPCLRYRMNCSIPRRSEPCNTGTCTTCWIRTSVR